MPVQPLFWPLSNLRRKDIFRARAFPFSLFPIAQTAAAFDSLGGARGSSAEKVEKERKCTTSSNKFVIGTKKPGILFTIRASGQGEIASKIAPSKKSFSVKGRYLFFLAWSAHFSLMYTIRAEPLLWPFRPFILPDSGSVRSRAETRDFIVVQIRGPGTRKRAA